ncbi:MAG: hypothetical protein AAGG01_19315, partial [Planctomycetota bacterium]
RLVSYPEWYLSCVRPVFRVDAAEEIMDRMILGLPAELLDAQGKSLGQDGGGEAERVGSTLTAFVKFSAPVLGASAASRAVEGIVDPIGHAHIWLAGPFPRVAHLRCLSGYAWHGKRENAAARPKEVVFASSSDASIEHGFRIVRSLST